MVVTISWRAGLLLRGILSTLWATRLARARRVVSPFPPSLVSPELHADARDKKDIYVVADEDGTQMVMKIQRFVPVPFPSPLGGR